MRGNVVQCGMFHRAIESRRELVEVEIAAFVEQLAIQTVFERSRTEPAIRILCKDSTAGSGIGARRRRRFRDWGNQAASIRNDDSNDFLSESGKPMVNTRLIAITHAKRRHSEEEKQNNRRDFS